MGVDLIRQVLLELWNSRRVIWEDDSFTLQTGLGIRKLCSNIVFGRRGTSSSNFGDHGCNKCSVSKVASGENSEASSASG